MPLILDKSTITSLGIIRPWHVSQSVDAFTGLEAYAITISGSLITTGSFINVDENNFININSTNRTLYDSIGNVSLTWANGLTASSFNVTDITINNSGFINGSPILTQAGATGYVTSVNGIFPINGNVSTGITAVITGNSASLVVSSSGAITGSIGEGTVWVVSGDPNPNNNGDAYIFASGPPGVWYPIAPLDVPAADARYILKNGNDSHTGSLYISGSSIELSLSGNLVVHHPGDNAVNINSNARTLFDSTGIGSILWGTRYLSDTSNIFSVDWDARNLFDSSTFLSLDWNNRQLIQSDGATITLDWENALFTGSVYGTSSWAESASYAVTSAFAPNFANTDLTITAPRQHNTNGYDLTITNNLAYSESYLYLGAGIGNYAQLAHGVNNISVGTSSINLSLTPAYKSVLYASGSEIVINEVKGFNTRIEGGTDDNLMYFQDSGSGRIGIGKKTPSAKLDINGSVLITGSLTTTGIISSPATPKVGTRLEYGGSTLNIDANVDGLIKWESTFPLAPRNLNISNLSDGQSVTVFVRNTSTFTRQITINARATNAGGYTYVSCYRFGTIPPTSPATQLNLSTNNSAVVQIVNIGGEFLGAIS